MAENEPKPADVDALAAMAAGADLDEPNPYLEQQAEIENPNAAAAPAPDLAHLGVTKGNAPATDPRVAVPTTPQVSRAESARRLAAQSSAAQSNQLKKMMIPLMICVGGLLVGLAIFTLSCSSMIFRDDAKASGVAWAFVLGPLGLILLVGAYWFILEGKKRK